MLLFAGLERIASIVAYIYCTQALACSKKYFVSCQECLSCHTTYAFDALTTPEGPGGPCVPLNPLSPCGPCVPLNPGRPCGPGGPWAPSSPSVPLSCLVDQVGLEFLFDYLCYLFYHNNYIKFI